MFDRIEKTPSLSAGKPRGRHVIHTHSPDVATAVLHDSLLTVGGVTGRHGVSV